MSTSKLREMFSDIDPYAPHGRIELGERFEDYKAVISKAIERHDAGLDRFVPRYGVIKGGNALDSLAEKVAAITKSLSVEDQASLASEIEAVKAATADITKDWVSAGVPPSNTQLVPYDLEEGAKRLWPKFTPLRNSTARTKGVGTGRQFRRLLGLTNLGLGGVADLSPFMNSETVSTNFGSLALRRGAKISYTADSVTIPYVEMGYSDQVNWKAYFQALGFDDLRGLSQTALLWSHLVGEEKAMLYSRGTATGFVGSVSAPTITIAASGTGGTLGAATYFAKATAKASFGESVVSAEVSAALTAGQNLTITVTGFPANATANFNLYLGTASGGETFQTSFVGNSVTITGGYTTSGATPPVADSSADPNGFDGYLAVQANSANGAYFRNVNGLLINSPGGTAGVAGSEFQTAFKAMWNLVYATPDEIWTTSTIRSALGDALVNQGSTAYRIAMTDEGGKVLGQLVNGFVNQSDPGGKIVDLNVHPYMPAGNALIRTVTLPFPDSEIGETTQMVMTQDYMSVDWPSIQFTYDQSTYTMGTMVHYAPKWNGLLTGITNT